MRRLTTRKQATDERGAVAVVVAIVFSLVLVGMGALVIDVGQLYLERRELQNGADAGALGLADLCAKTGCGAYLTTAKNLADANAQTDNLTALADVDPVCGTAPGLPACSTTPAGVPAHAFYVSVGTKTQTATGNVVLPVLSQVLGNTGQTVGARAVAAYGTPGSIVSALPLTISLCEWKYYTADGTLFAPPIPDAPPTPTWPAAPYQEATLYFHDTDNPVSGCPAAKKSGADLPGGFGWLQPDPSPPSDGCTTSSDVTHVFDDKTGRPVPSTCSSAELASLVGKTVALPIYYKTNDLNGTNGHYYMDRFAAFYLTGYSINGTDKVPSLKTGALPCGGSKSCISGYFTTTTIDDGTLGSGPAGGVNVVQLID
ncbi:MAG: pilus assembly protein TadG-related protein [Motilibacteraceae bacterium]